jgi:hypothetical protein
MAMSTAGLIQPTAFAAAVAIAGLGDPCLRAAVRHGLLGVSRRLASAERIWRGFSGERLSTVCRPGVSTNHARYRVAAGRPDYSRHSASGVPRRLRLRLPAGPTSGLGWLQRDPQGSSFDLNELELLVGTPLGKHLSFFLQYDLFETEIERPTGPGEANETDTRKNITFETEGPRVPGMAKLIWNSILPQTMAPLDSLNIIGGINELPLGVLPGASPSLGLTVLDL